MPAFPLESPILQFSVILIAYLVGAIPFGLILGRLVAGVDVRESGSGNIGASNVSRVVGRWWGRLTIFLDGAKGAVGAWLGLALLDGHLVWVAALASVVGHCWPIYLRFRGGKGVATSAGVFAVLTPLLLLCVFAAWVAIYAISKRTSIASLSAAVGLMGTLAVVRPEYLPLMGALLVVIVLRHRENIGRIRRGEEPTSKL